MLPTRARGDPRPPVSYHNRLRVHPKPGGDPKSRGSLLQYLPTEAQKAPRLPHSRGKISSSSRLSRRGLRTTLRSHRTSHLRQNVPTRRTALAKGGNTSKTGSPPLQQAHKHLPSPEPNAGLLYPRAACSSREFACSQPAQPGRDSPRG